MSSLLERFIDCPSRLVRVLGESVPHTPASPAFVSYVPVGGVATPGGGGRNVRPEREIGWGAGAPSRPGRLPPGRGPAPRPRSPPGGRRCRLRRGGCG